jgi:predicted nicotinamide N-methyase
VSCAQETSWDSLLNHASVKAARVTTIIDPPLSPEIRQFVQSNVPVVPVPTVPEILSHKAGPKSGLWRLAEMDKDFDTPYWAHYWEGGLALARHVLNYPEIAAGRVVLDLGAGSGIAGIAAALDRRPLAHLSAPNPP